MNGVLLGKDGKIFGPFSSEQIESMRQSGELATFLWICRDKKRGWELIQAPPEFPEQEELTKTVVFKMTKQMDSGQQDQKLPKSTAFEKNDTSVEQISQTGSTLMTTFSSIPKPEASESPLVPISSSGSLDHSLPIFNGEMIPLPGELTPPGKLKVESQPSLEKSSINFEPEPKLSDEKIQINEISPPSSIHTLTTNDSELPAKNDSMNPLPFLKDAFEMREETSHLYKNTGADPKGDQNLTTSSGNLGILKQVLMIGGNTLVSGSLVKNGRGFVYFDPDFQYQKKLFPLFRAGDLIRLECIKNSKPISVQLKIKKVKKVDLAWRYEILLTFDQEAQIF